MTSSVAARRYAVPALALAAAGVGFVLARSASARSDRRRRIAFERDREDGSVPVLNIGRARIYDPDAEPGHPAHDVLESRRDLTAQA